MDKRINELSFVNFFHDCQALKNLKAEIEIENVKRLREKKRELDKEEEEESEEEENQVKSINQEFEMIQRLNAINQSIHLSINESITHSINDQTIIH